MILDISENKFAGSCEFHALPPGLRELNAAGNNFGGELRLVRIPFTLLVLNLSNNNLSGNIDFSSLRDECHLSFHKKTGFIKDSVIRFKRNKSFPSD